MQPVLGGMGQPHREQDWDRDEFGGCCWYGKWQHSLGLPASHGVPSLGLSGEAQTLESLSQWMLPPRRSRSGHCKWGGRSLSRCANSRCVFFSALVLPQPLKTMKSACSGSACGPGNDRGLSGAGSTRSTATSSWPPTFGSPPTAPTAEILSGKALSPGNL